MNKKAYISGKITDCKEYKKIFKDAEIELKKLGYSVMNPAELPQGFEYEEYMHICYAMIDVCDIICMLPNSNESKGARLELEYAIKNGKSRMDLF